MRKTFAFIVLTLIAAFASAQRVSDLNGKQAQLYPDKDHAPGWAKPGGGSGQNLIYNGGPVIISAKTVAIFWGSYWGTSSNLNATASELLGFYSHFGTSPEYNTITEYSGIQLSNLSNNYWLDTSNPPTNVTDSILQGEVRKYLSTHASDASTIYEVFLPPTSYSSFSTYTSCGGPNLYYCAYHSNFNYNGTDVKYASLPYPSCGGCQWTGWTAAQNFEHFACHETREAVTDPDGDAWYDHRGYEADDKCAWSPAPFIGSGGYGYQWEWSNFARGCIQSR
jgi:hypothetical protein